MTADLVQFLHVRLDEDERIARAASDGPWKPGVRSGLDVVEGDGWTVCNASDSDVAHIATHDPARVLREIDTKRQLLADLLSEPHSTLKPGGSTEIYCVEDSGDGEPCDCGRDTRVARHLRLLALPYADHPDYRDEWRPAS